MVESLRDAAVDDDFDVSDVSLDELDGVVDDEAAVSLLDDDGLDDDAAMSLERPDDADMLDEGVLVEADGVVGVVAADRSPGARSQPATSVVPARIAASSVMR